MDKVLQIIKSEFKLRFIEESLKRLEKCLGELSHPQIWYRANDNMNAVGNLIMHLSGNITQYIIAGLGGQKDNRERDKEFDPRNNSMTKAELLALISDTIHEANAVVQGLSYEQLSQEVKIQGFDHTYLSAIIHVIEHLSYHVGQITFYTKQVRDIDTQYYGGHDLNITE